MTSKQTTVPVQKCPWAVILCRFKGSPKSRSIEKFFRQCFKPGSGGLVEYWRDISLGHVDIGKSRIFGWIELGITRQEAGGKGRTALVNEARQAAKQAGIDVETGFFSQIAVFTHDWNSDNLTQAQMTGTDRFKYWIDGSSDGKTVSAPPHGHSGSFLAHEMGHVHALGHDYASDLKTPYGDPFCIMSAMNVNSFIQSATQKAFGPSLCLPHMLLKGWMDTSRIYRDAGDWMTQTQGITLPLATIGDRDVPANLGIQLHVDNGADNWDYYLEMVRASSWNQGFGGNYVLVRRLIENQKGKTSALLYQCQIPDDPAQVVDFVEPQGYVWFQAQHMASDGKIVKVSARKLQPPAFWRHLVSAVSSVPGGVSLFAVGQDGRMWSTYFDPRQSDPAWVDWFPLGGNTFPSVHPPTALSTVPGGISLHIIGSDYRLWSSYFDPRQQDPGWVDWFSLGANLFPGAAGVSAVSSLPGATSLFIIGLDGKVWSQYFDPRFEDAKWSGWFPLGDNTFPATTSVSAISTVPGGASLFVVGFDGKVWSQFFDPRMENAAWSGWFPLGENTFPQSCSVSAVSSLPGATSLFIIGHDGRVWSQYFDPRFADARWSGWFPLGENTFPQQSPISAVSTVAGGVSLFVVGWDGKVWSQYFDPRQADARWSGWFPLGDNTFPQSSPVIAVSSLPGAVSLFIIGLDGRVWSQYFDPRFADAKWSGWFPIGANTFPTA